METSWFLSFSAWCLPGVSLLGNKHSFPFVGRSLQWERCLWVCVHWLLFYRHVPIGALRSRAEWCRMRPFPIPHATESLCDDACIATPMHGEAVGKSSIERVVWGLSLFLTIGHGNVRSETLCQCAESRLLFQVQCWPMKGRLPWGFRFQSTHND